MSQRQNLNIPGHAHELTFSCYKRFRFLAADRTRQWLVESIDDARQTSDFLVWAYVFMPDHVHLIIFPQKKVYDIALIRRDIKVPVAKAAIRYLEEHSPHWIEKITRVRGKKKERLFWRPGGGYDRNIDQPETLWKMIDYVHLNPVRKGLTQRAVDWHWSSAAWYVRGESPLRLDSTTDAWSGH